MDRWRAAAVVTWANVAMLGVPALPAALFLAEKGHLPSLWGLFQMYGAPWSSNLSNDRVLALLLAFLGLTLGAALSGWLLWAKFRTGAVLNLVLLPVEAIFWIGFALPLPWLLGIARVVMLVQARPRLPNRAHETGSCRTACCRHVDR